MYWIGLSLEERDVSSSERPEVCVDSGNSRYLLPSSNDSFQCPSPSRSALCDLLERSRQPGWKHNVVAPVASGARDRCMQPVRDDSATQPKNQPTFLLHVPPCSPRFPAYAAHTRAGIIILCDSVLCVSLVFPFELMKRPAMIISVLEDNNLT